MATCSNMGNPARLTLTLTMTLALALALALTSSNILRIWASVKAEPLSAVSCEITWLGEI